MALPLQRIFPADFFFAIGIGSSYTACYSSLYNLVYTLATYAFKN